MRHVWIMATQSLLISARERVTFLVGLLMPAAMMLMLGLAMGGRDQVTVSIDVLDEDGSALSGQFVAVLRAELETDSAFRLCTYRTAAESACGLKSNLKADQWRSTADQRLKDTDTYGAILIQPGFGASLSAGQPVTVLFKSSESLSAPTLARQKIDAAVSRMSGSVAITNLVLDVAQQEFKTFEAGSAARAAAFDTVHSDVESAWDQRPVLITSEGTKKQVPHLGFNQSGPGVAIMFVLMFMLNTSTVLVSEREQGTLQRLVTLPIPRSAILAGKLLGRYLFGVIQFLVLLGVGLMMGVEWGHNIIGIALVILIFTFTSTALGLALATVVRTSAQADNISLLMGLTLSPLGGAWWPLEIVPGFMKVIGHFSPVAWGMDTFQSMMFYGGGVIDILPKLAVLLAMGALFFAFGVWNFKYE